MGYTYVLENRTQYPGTSRDDRYGVLVYYAKNGTLPPGLHSSQAAPHSWEAHIQRLINHERNPENSGTGVTPRSEHQANLIAELTQSHSTGKPGFVMSYPTGFGKTYTTIGAVNAIRPKRVLVIAPLAYTAGWREAIARAATGDTEWVVINPDRLTHTFRLPTEFPPLYAYSPDEKALMALREGLPITEFDIVISDEAQTFAHIESNRTRLWQSLIGWNDNGKPPTSFTINLSATNWSTPAETVSAAHILAAARGVPVPSTMEIETAYEDWLRENFELTYNLHNGRWRWDKNINDLNALTAALYEAGMGASANRETLKMGKQARSLHHIHLSDDERALYPQSWRSFLLDQGKDISDVQEPTDPRAQYMRQVQKAALIKAPYVADLVVDYLDLGYQVIVPAWLSGTITELNKRITTQAKQRLGEGPTNGRWAISLTGDDTGETRTTKIKGFQAGFFPVIITSVTTGISLHANEANGGFKDHPATSTPRVTIFGDVRWGGKQSLQAEGRGARDGEEADAIYCVALGTAEVRAMATIFRNVSDTRALAVESGLALTDADIESFSAMAEELEDLIERGDDA